MFNSLILVNPGDPLSNVAGETVKNAKLNKAQWFVVVIFAIMLTFIFVYSFTPAVNSLVPLEKTDIRIAFWILVISTILLVIAFMVPDIIKKFKNI